MNPRAEDRPGSKKMENQYPTRSRVAPAPTEASLAESFSRPPKAIEFHPHHRVRPAKTLPNHLRLRTGRHVLRLHPCAAPGDHELRRATCVHFRRTPSALSCTAMPPEAETACASSLTV